MELHDLAFHQQPCALQTGVFGPVGVVARHLLHTRLSRRGGERGDGGEQRRELRFGCEQLLTALAQLSCV